MEQPLEAFDEIKFSALSKSKQINQFIKNVTLGPNQTFPEDKEPSTNIIQNTPKTNMSPNIVVRVSPINLTINHLCNELERQRQDKVKEAVDKHITSFKQFSEKQDIETKRQRAMHHHVLQNRVQQQNIMILNALEVLEKDKIMQEQQLVQYYKDLAEKKRRSDLELEEKEKRKQQINTILDRLKADQLEFRSIYQEITNLVKNCKYLNQLKVALGETIKQFKAMPESMEEVVTQCRNGVISESDCQKTSMLVLEIKELLEVVKQKILEVNETQQVEASPKPVIPTVAAVTSTPITSQLSSSSPSSDLGRYISRSSLKIYTELQAFMQTYTLSLNELLHNESLKQFRFDCKKAVNIPVNAISATSASHLTDKYSRLSSLLNGKPVEVGGTRVCAANQSLGVEYCTNLLASNFVLQGDLMVSSKPEAAFAYAAVIVALWTEHANFGKLLLAYFHSQCPYLVPFYLPRTVDQTDEEYYRSQGYRYSDGIVEKQDKFLKRMAGTVRLYAALIVTKPKRGHANNPHSIDQGWRWLAAFVNLEPKPDITATVLYVFLETAGSTLEKVYGKPFRKLMVYICQIYLPIIQKIDSGGPVTRLEVLLQNYAKQGRFELPNGIFPPNFW